MVVRRFEREVRREERIWVRMGEEGEYGRGLEVSWPPMGVYLYYIR